MFRASLCPSSGGQRPCYCIWCVVLVLLDVVGSGCGALRCGMRALLASYSLKYVYIPPLFAIIQLYNYESIKFYFMCVSTCPGPEWYILVFNFLQDEPQLRSSYRRICISEVRFIQNNFTKTVVLNKLKQVFPFLCIIRFHYLFFFKKKKDNVRHSYENA